MFEYRTYRVAKTDDVENVLNGHARDGWKLHTITESTYGKWLIVFERQKEHSRHRVGRNDYFGPG